MGFVVAVIIGVMVGTAASKLHPLTNAGVLMGGAAGVLGALIGSALLRGRFTALLSDVEMAGLALGATVGALVLALAAGFAWNRFRSD